MREGEMKCKIHAQELGQSAQPAAPCGQAAGCWWAEVALGRWTLGSLCLLAGIETWKFSQTWCGIGVTGAFWEKGESCQ